MEVGEVLCLLHFLLCDTLFYLLNIEMSNDKQSIFYLTEARMPQHLMGGQKAG